MLKKCAYTDGTLFANVTHINTSIIFQLSELVLQN